MDDQRIDRTGSSGIAFLKESARDLLRATIISVCVLAPLFLLLSLLDPGSPKSEHIPTLAEKITLGLCSGVLTGVVLGVVGGILFALIRLLRKIFPTT